MPGSLAGVSDVIRTAAVSGALALSFLAMPSHAEPRAALQQCFAASDLAAHPGEEKPARGDRRFDRGVAALTLDGAETIEPVAQPLRGAIRRVTLPPAQKWIALTFDLCEERGEVAGYDGAIFDYLRAENVKATLFAGGKWMLSHDARARQLMTDPLFEIANHSETHKNLRKINGTALQTEIIGPQKAYAGIRAKLASTQCAANHPDALAAIPKRMRLFRFPFGACNPAAMSAVNDAGFVAIQWDLSTGDPSPAQSAGAIARQMTQNAKPGSIIIAHANGRGYHTAEALPIAIPKLKAMGFEFVTISELLAAGTPVSVSECYDRKPGDTDRYDNLFALKTAKPKPASPFSPIETTVEPR